jgi:four helix bundle protein
MQKELIEKNPLLKHTIEFAQMISDYCDSLYASKKFIIANQLFKAGTSIGANCMEAQNAESKQDFVHKLKISAKEADETQYWLTVCNFSKDNPDVTFLEEKLLEIQKLLSKIISTTKNSLKYNYLIITLSNYHIKSSCLKKY